MAAALLPAALLLKTDLGFGQVGPDDVGDFAQADGDTARIVDAVGRLLGEQHTRKDLGDVVYMDRAAHGVHERQDDSVAACRLGEDVSVIDRAPDLGWAG